MKFLKGLTLNVENLPTYTAFKGDYVVNVNKHFLYECINSDNPIFTPEIKTAIQNVYDKCDANNILKVNHYRANNLGRFYPSNNISLISLSRHVKHSIFKLMNWVDIDMVKGHPTILYSLLKNIGYDLPTFKKYIDNPNEILNELKEHYATDETLTTDKVKDFFNISIYGGGFNRWLKEIDDANIEIKTDKPHSIMNDFLKECKEVSNLIFKSNNSLVEKFKQKYHDKTEYELKNSIMSYYCGTIENEILHICYKFLIKNDVIKARHNVELEYDGLCFKMPDNKTIEELHEVIENLNDKIKKDTGLEVKFKIKPYDERHIHYDIIERAKEIEIIETERKSKEIIKFNETKLTEENPFAFGSIGEVFEDDEYKQVKNEFEKNYFKIESPLCYVWESSDGNINYYKSKDLDELVRDKNLPKYPVQMGLGVQFVPFIKIWKDDHNKRKYEKFVFEPNPAYENKGCYNLFKGFKNDDETIEPIDENESMFFKILKHLCSTEPETYEYMKAVIAHIIQKPYMKTNVGVILYSNLKGVGKDSLINGLNKLIGDEYYATINNIEDITKNFNNHLVNKFVIYSDEIDARARKVADKIKSVITRTKINLEKKGFDAISVSDYSNWWFSTNHKNSFKNEEGDRRNLMIECPEVIPSKDFFDAFYEEIDDPIKVKQIFRYFKLYKQDKYHIGNGRVLDTKYKKETMLESKQSYYQFIYKAVRQYENNIYTSSSFYELSKSYANKNYLTANYSITEFGKVLTKTFDTFKVRRSSGFVFKFGRKNEILKCLFEADPIYYRFVNNLEPDFIPSFENNMEDELLYITEGDETD